MKHLNTILLISIVAINIAARHLSLIEFKWFFIGDAICWVLAFLMIVRLTTGIVRTIAEFCFILTISNLMDELFFNPQSFGWNEYVFLFILVVLFSFKFLRNGRV